MSKLSRLHLLVSLVVCLLLAQSALAAPPPTKAEEGVSGNLVTTKWLAENLKSPGVIILDASPGPMYAANHIPGAINVNIFDLISYGYDQKATDAARSGEKLYQSWGINSPAPNNRQKLVIYDAGGSNLATSLFFHLVYHGLSAKDLYIVDGGSTKWQKEGLPVTKDATPAPKAGNYKFTKLNEDVEAELPEVLNASGDTEKSVLVEGLDPDWHFGETRFFGKGGHIPNGVLATDTDFYNADKTFKSPQEIQEMLTYLKIPDGKQVYTYCGGGVSATVPFFAAKYIAHYPRVKVYSQSELGWIRDQRDLPYWTFDAPYLMRDAQWMQTWSSRMLRGFIDPHVNVVDVRPAEEFNEGHVPFAVNIPADAFKKNVAQPQKLAELLGTSGVNAANEAVVVSGAGVTKDSALVFLMLVKLGQKKVSVLISPADSWAKQGIQTKDPTVVTAKRDPRTISIPPTTYAVDVSSGQLIADASSTKGIYPKVFIVSGKDMPSKAPDGKVIHVPYTDLLNADGTPKAAKDIWATLSKAGLTRYAEIVCISDDPGEAAANYYTLKLMGFPDVKVLVPSAS